MTVSGYTVAERKIYTPSGGFLPIPDSFSLYDTLSDQYGEETVTVSSSNYSNIIYHARRPGFISRWRLTDNTFGNFSETPVIRRFGIEKSLQMEERWREFPDNAFREVLNNPRFGGAASGTDMYPSLNIYYANSVSGTSATVEGAVIPFETANYGSPYSQYSYKDGTTIKPSLRWTNKQYYKVDVNWSGVECLHRVTCWSFQPSSWGRPIATQAVDGKIAAVVNLVSGFDAVSAFDLSSGYIQNYTSALSAAPFGYTTLWNIGYYYTTSSVLDQYKNVLATNKTLHILYPSNEVGVIFQRSSDGLCAGVAAWQHFDSNSQRQCEQIEFGIERFSTNATEDSDSGMFFNINSTGRLREDGWQPMVFFLSFGNYNTVRNNLAWLATTQNIYHKAEPVMPSSIVTSGYLPPYTFPYKDFDSMAAFYTPIYGTNNSGVSCLLRYDIEPGLTYIRYDDYGNIITPSASYGLPEITDANDPFITHIYSSIVASTIQEITYTERMPQVNFWRSRHGTEGDPDFYDHSWMHRWDCADLLEWFAYGSVFTLDDLRYFGWMGGYAAAPYASLANKAFQYFNIPIYTEASEEGDPSQILKFAVIPTEFDPGGYAYGSKALNNRFTSGLGIPQLDYAMSRPIVHWANKAYQVVEPNIGGNENLHRVTWWSYSPERLDQNTYDGLYSFGLGVALTSSLSSFELFNMESQTAYNLPSTITTNVEFYSYKYIASVSGTGAGGGPGVATTTASAPHYFTANYVAVLATVPSSNFCVAVMSKISSAINDYSRPTEIGIAQQLATSRMYDGPGAQFEDHFGPIFTLNGNTFTRVKGWIAVSVYIYTGLRADFDALADYVIANGILDNGISTSLPSVVTQGTIPPNEVYGSLYTKHL